MITIHEHAATLALAILLNDKPAHDTMCEATVVRHEKECPCPGLHDCSDYYSCDCADYECMPASFKFVDGADHTDCACFGYIKDAKDATGLDIYVKHSSEQNSLMYYVGYYADEYDTEPRELIGAAATSEIELKYEDQLDVLIEILGLEIGSIEYEKITTIDNVLRYVNQREALIEAYLYSTYGYRDIASWYLEHVCGL